MSKAIYKTAEEVAQARAAWALGVSLLLQSGMAMPKARSCFGKLLSEHKIAAPDLLPCLEAAKATGTMDAMPFLVRGAQRASERVNRPDPALQCDWS